ncbi:Serine/threonine-protein kinase AfsK [Streptomyces sp. YIM 121038]|uniref:protein kinase domain-containing protein n=1 Tax=Streptomyces sp. YIM 121038 TaxID=2136401 RepID=UPI0011107DF1|nr:serine/threonine-protein kinase [Streptomyces sp. YIM 121038]QCX78415.1 Serine/threonine-protein kinase AfsK [Streptomyces sp. YIM 121038]
MHPLEPDEPTAVGPYRLLGRLGSGGMGRVYVGRSAGGRTVAVKVVHPHFALDEEFRARFRREVEAARRVGGQWTAPVLDADPEAALPWVATGYAAGPSLTEAVRDAGPLPEHSARVLGAGLAEALAHVHALGLVHRDVKPSNVLLTLDGPRLIDFGIARATDGTASLTSTGVSIGSPGYMAPEQILGKAATGAADVFSLGASLVYAATGEPPFAGDTSAALLYKVVHEEPDLGALGGELRDLAAACLAKDAAARPAPAEVARRLAPEGAAPLVAAGWLPGPLVERVSRSAVRLLDLEAKGDGAGGAAASGPVSFAGPAVGVFGPPDASYGAGGPGAAVPPTPLPRGGPADARPSPVPPPPAAAPPGKVSLSVAATAAPGTPDGRGRRVSCTVALAVAGALAAVLVGSAFLFDVLPGSGAGGDGDGSAGKRPPAATGGASDSDGLVPKRYLGKWRGKASAQDGLVALGTFDVTISQVTKAGERVGTVTQTDLIGGTCVDVLTLTSATEKRLALKAVGATSNGGGCSQAAHTVWLRPVGSELQYTSEDPKAGDPEARLRRVRG